MAVKCVEEATDISLDVWKQRAEITETPAGTDRIPVISSIPGRHSRQLLRKPGQGGARSRTLLHRVRMAHLRLRAIGHHAGQSKFRRAERIVFLMRLDPSLVAIPACRIEGCEPALGMGRMSRL
jgi:hypothetical protein